MRPSKKDQKKKVKFLTGKEEAEKLIKQGILTELAGQLESLPSQIATHIVSDATTMLDLRQEIADRLTSLRPFGTQVTLLSGESTEYIPGCLRKYKNPCTGSNRTRDLPEYKSIEREFDELLQKYKRDGTAKLKKLAELEISHRYSILQSLAAQGLGDLSTNLVMMEQCILKNKKGEVTLSNTVEQVGWYCAWEYGKNFKVESELKLLQLDSEQAWKDAFEKVRKEKNGVRFTGAVTHVNAHQDEKDIIAKVLAHLANLCPKMMFEAWTKLSNDAVFADVNRAVSVRNEKRKQRQSQDATLQAITAGATSIDRSTVKQIANEAVERALNKANRSKSLADRKSHRSNATKGGRNTSSSQDDDSDSSHPKKKRKTKQQQKGKKQQPQKQQKQRKKKDKGKGKGKGNQDESASGGKRGRKRKR